MKEALPGAVQEKEVFKGHHDFLFPDPTERLETHERYCSNNRADLKFLQKSFIRALSTAPG